jgi:hypothetical protein
MAKYKIPERGERLADFGRHLQGLGGLQTSRVRALKGSKIGPANEGRRLSATERKAIEEKMRREGKL